MPRNGHCAYHFAVGSSVWVGRLGRQLLSVVRGTEDRLAGFAAGRIIWVGTWRGDWAGPAQSGDGLLGDRAFPAHGARLASSNPAGADG